MIFLSCVISSERVSVMRKYFRSLTFLSGKKYADWWWLKKHLTERACACKWMISSTSPSCPPRCLLAFILSDCQHSFVNLAGIFIINLSSSSLRIARTFFLCWKEVFWSPPPSKEPYKQPKLHFFVWQLSFNFQPDSTGNLYTSVHKPDFYSYLILIPSYSNLF